MSPEQKTAHILPWPKTPPRHEQERQFLPAALEIVETPASPVGRATAFIIILFFCLALVWSYLGHVDIIASAQGLLVPAGKIKIVQPLETGIVSAIHIQDGDRVHAGDLVISLDETEILAERDKIVHQLQQARLDTARLTALKTLGKPEEVERVFAPPEGIADSQVQLARSYVHAQASEQAARIEAINEQVAQKQADADEVRASMEKLKATLPILEERLAIRNAMFEKQVGDRFQLLDAQQPVTETKHDIVVAESQLISLLAAAQSLIRQKEQIAAEYQHQVLSDLSDAEQDVRTFTQDLLKAERRLAETKLTAPIDGIVQQLAVHTLGGVVTSAQPLMQIVPEDRPLNLEVKVANADVGFIRVGQEVQIKVETYNFTRYGLVQGHVTSLSADVVTDDKRAVGSTGQGGDSKGTQTDSGSLSPAYVARIEPDAKFMTIDGRQEPLKPGMAATAEIKTGSRRIIQYLLSPIRQYEDESMRER
ncbi:hypothetical protein BJF93_12330 [Xaviernesmea oryzae]|uniref:Membrane fusion protein (MFP) family protein n=1 Tax=Xaviernesmea oryzae TaxID=464029 RepID=A0A1Q9AVP5_9HYPH|nr:hypothetical protein BJF93_12330 [Xaviernesmea oryzae]